MGSKSSSGSLVKSVETMLPKGVNLKHVLLAVLVGLLLCMMFGQTVEGYPCTVPSPLPTGYTGLTAGGTAEVGGSGSTVPANLSCDSSAGYTGNPTVSCPQTEPTCKNAAGTAICDDPTNFNASTWNAAGGAGKVAANCPTSTSSPAGTCVFNLGGQTPPSETHTLGHRFCHLFEDLQFQ